MKSINLSRLSVYVAHDVHPIYEKLTSRSMKRDNMEDFPFETMKDLFVASACLGAKYNRFVEVKSGREIFDSTLFSENEVTTLVSLAFYKTKDLEKLSDGRAILDIAQGWANGGIHYLNDQLLSIPGRPLYTLVNLIWQETQEDQEGLNEVKVRFSGFSEERDNELLNEKSSKNFNITDSADLLTILEIELRKFIADRLGSLSPSWWKQRIPNDVRGRAEKRKADRELPYPGMEQQDRPLYDYLDFPDLKTIITMKSNWDDIFKQTFVRTDLIQVKLDEIAMFRNDIAHHRDIPIQDREIFVPNVRQVLRAIRRTEMES